MSIDKLSLEQVIAICNIHHIYFYINTDNYIPGDVICIWCKHRIYIGLPYNRIPEDLQTYFLLPRDYRRYVKIVEELTIR